MNIVYSGLKLGVSYDIYCAQDGLLSSKLNVVMNDVKILPDIVWLSSRTLVLRTAFLSNNTLHAVMLGGALLIIASLLTIRIIDRVNN